MAEGVKQAVAGLRRNLCCSFDEECREQVADGLKGRGIHLYPDTTPTRYTHLQVLGV